MKRKQQRERKHVFTLEVRTIGSRKSAELAVLTAFAFSLRPPDGCAFNLIGESLRKQRGKKNNSK